MAGQATLVGVEHISIQQLSPNLSTLPARFILGVIVLEWPYSSVKHALTLLLAEPDFRLRHDGGQVRVRFVGPSAQAVAEKETVIGDELKLSLEGVEWVEHEDCSISTPGKDAQWDLHYRDRLLLEIRHVDGTTSTVEVNQAPLSELGSLTPAPPQTPARSIAPSQRTPKQALTPTEWSSPAFFVGSKTSRSQQSSVDDLFSGPNLKLGFSRKRVKLGRGVGEWRLVSKTPSPENLLRGQTPARQPSLNEDDENISKGHIAANASLTLALTQQPGGSITEDLSVELDAAHETPHLVYQTGVNTSADVPAFPKLTGQQQSKQSSPIDQMILPPKKPSITPDPIVSEISDAEADITEEAHRIPESLGSPTNYVSVNLNQQHDTAVPEQTPGETIDLPPMTRNQERSPSSASRTVTPGLVDAHLSIVPGNRGSTDNNTRLEMQSRHDLQEHSPDQAGESETGSAIPDSLDEPAHGEMDSAPKTVRAEPVHFKPLDRDVIIADSDEEDQEEASDDNLVQDPQPVSGTTGDLLGDMDEDPTGKVAKELQKRSAWTERRRTVEPGTVGEQEMREPVSRVRQSDSTWDLNRQSEAKPDSYAQVEEDSIRNVSRVVIQSSTAEGPETAEPGGLQEHPPTGDVPGEYPRGSTGDLQHGANAGTDADEVVDDRRTREVPKALQQWFTYTGKRRSLGPIIHDEQKPKEVIRRDHPREAEAGGKGSAGLHEPGHIDDHLPAQRVQLGSTTSLAMEERRRTVGLEIPQPDQAATRKDDLPSNGTTRLAPGADDEISPENDVPIPLRKWFSIKRRRTVEVGALQALVVAENRVQSSQIPSSNGNGILHGQGVQGPDVQGQRKRRRISADNNTRPVSAVGYGSVPNPAPKPPAIGFLTRLAYFTPLSALAEHYSSNVDVFAISASSASMIQVKVGPRDHVTVLKLRDRSSGPNATTVRIFRPYRQALPGVGAGDVVMLRSFRVISFQRTIGLISTAESAWAVWKGGTTDMTAPEIRGPPVEFGDEEMNHARRLMAWWRDLPKSDSGETSS